RQRAASWPSPGSFSWPPTHDATSSLEVLNTVLSVARRLALPSQAELAQVRARLMEMATGQVASVPTSQQAIDAASEVIGLRQQVSELSEVNERLNESIEEAEGRIGHLQAQVEDGAVVSAQAQQAIDDLQQTEARLRREAQVGAAHLAELDAQLDELQAAPPPDLPPVMVDELSRVVVALNNGNHVWSVLRQANEHDAPDETDELQAQQAMGQVLERLRSLLPVVPAQTTQVTPDAPGAVQMLEMLSPMVGALQDASEKFRELLHSTGLDLDDDETLLPDDLELVLDLMEESVGAVQMFFPFLQRGIMQFGERLLQGANPVPDQNPDQLEAGTPWPHARGEDVWVLSAARRSLTRPRGRSGQRFADLVGPGVTRQAISDWLKIRPTGGRVYVTPDGDACTLAPEGAGYVYLGRIPGW
ncbi:MAG: hypothetical protein OSB43_17970, partial [Nocardioides sp.]|uniref:hypothetical protein n=1 Tax=Nocardioides sp. TaxID=35761 RepID=UPI0023A13B96